MHREIPIWCKKEGLFRHDRKKENEEIEKVNRQKIGKKQEKTILTEKVPGVSEKVIHRPCILVSACLLGVMCRYDGKSNGLAGLERLQETTTFLPFCPEVYGGLPTPREPSEIRDGKVCSKSGRDVTAQFEKGAREALRMAKLLGCSAAILKERSPSCGSHQIYDGTFQGSGSKAAVSQLLCLKKMEPGCLTRSRRRNGLCMGWRSTAGGKKGGHQKNKARTEKIK